MAWERRRRRASETGILGFLVQNLSLAAFVALALGLLVAARADDALFDDARATINDAGAPLMEALAVPAELFKRGREDLWSVFQLFEENRRLREANQKLSAAQTELADLKRKVQLYEKLLKASSEDAVSSVAARVIADATGPFARTVLINAGHSQGVAKGQAVVDDRGLLGRVITSGNRSARVLLVTDLNSRVPVMIEGTNLKAIMVGDNSGRPTLEYLPRGTRIKAGARVVTTPDGGVFPPGVPVGTVVAGASSPRVQLFTVEGRSDFVRALRYTAPVDVDNAPPEPMPGAVANPSAKPAATDTKKAVPPAASTTPQAAVPPLTPVAVAQQPTT